MANQIPHLGGLRTERGSQQLLYARNSLKAEQRLCKCREIENRASGMHRAELNYDWFITIGEVHTGFLLEGSNW